MHTSCPANFNQSMPLTTYVIEISSMYSDKTRRSNVNTGTDKHQMLVVCDFFNAFLAMILFFHKSKTSVRGRADTGAYGIP